MPLRRVRTVESTVVAPQRNGPFVDTPDLTQRRQLRSRHLELVDLPLGEVLYEPCVTLSHVFFSTTAIVLLLYVMENGASAEIAVAGNEGLMGISLFMGGESTPSRAVVQSAGHALSDEGRDPQVRVRPPRYGVAPAPAIYPGIDHANVANGGVQSPSFARPATVPLVALEP